MGPAISIVIALHDGRVGETIRALARQTVDPGLVEVVLVDAYCHPGVLAEAREVAGEVSGILQSRVVELPRSGRAVSWNRGIEEASAPLLLLLADDFVAAPGLVESHLALHLERPQDHVVGIGPAVFPPDDRSAFMAWLEDSGRLLGVSFTRPDPELLPAFFYGANTSIKRSLLERAGPFDEAFPHHGWDDHEMGI
ncbi:MAG: glycosyltransferase, partial [Actinobacteria bacterium]|nr:glycosyltransferase [Actinomycetota bacterium]